MRLAPSGLGKVPLVGLAIGEERCLEFGADLVGGLRYRRADGGRNPVQAGAEAFHGLDCAFDDAAFGALPARMGGCDDASLRVGQKDWRAVRREDAYCETADIRDHGIGLRGFARFPRGCHDQSLGGVSLLRTGQPSRLRAEPRRNPRPVFFHPVFAVGGAPPAVQRGVNAFRYPAGTQEKPMAQPQPP